MGNSTQADRRLAGQIAAHESWSNTPDRTARTQPARDALQASFERKVDPDGVLDPAERARRAENARKAHYARLALASAKARRAKAAARRQAASTEQRTEQRAG